MKVPRFSQSRNKLFVKLLMACGFLLIGHGASSQTESTDWPKGPIQLVVGYSAGGSTDLLARKIANSASQLLGRQVVVVNKVGAGGTVGMSYVARAKPDGYTLGIGSSATHATSLLSLETQPYHPIKNFTPITKLVDYHNVLVANPKLPFKDLQGLIKFVNDKQGGAVFGSAGPGSTNQLSMEMVLRHYGLPMIHAPYKGSGPALSDVIGGHIDMMFDITNTTLPHIKAGNLNAIAIAAPSRNDQLPDVPTLGEAGMKADVEEIYNLWIGLFGPENLPDPVRNKIDKTFQDVMIQPEIVAAMRDMGLSVALAGPAEFTNIIDRDYKFWSEFVKVSKNSEKK